MAMNRRERVRGRMAGGHGAAVTGGLAPGAGRDVDVRIGELRIDRLRPGDAQPLGDAVRRELERLFAERGVADALTSAVDRDRLDAAVAAWPSHAPAARIGSTIARAVYDGLNHIGNADARSLPGAVPSGHGLT
jgi:hypothetical protein